MTNQTNTYSQQMAIRLKQIMNHLDLTVAGFAAFINRDASHIYGILNVSRDFSDALAEHIGKLTGIKGATIKNINTEIPASISKCESIVEFRKNNKANPEYFLNTKTDRSINAFVSDVLVESKFLEIPRYLSEIEEFVASKYDKSFVKDKLSKALRYAVSKQTLKSEKKPIKLRNGDFGKRMVDVYWKNPHK
ncbi:hypothetical protein [Sphingobacterium sp. xlx-130]|uniref:hypothetical protein n=1 Tax=Sphingobacterium sp. xlx-130 TaxID=2654323 RepID=UPI0013DA680B|nr:hypothetical protein [Sphingobacterium sp. xlx-130]